MEYELFYLEFNTMITFCLIKKNCSHGKYSSSGDNSES